MSRNSKKHLRDVAREGTSKKDLTVFNDLKNCFKLIGLPVRDEVTDGQFQRFESEINRPEFSMAILVIYDLEHATVDIGLIFSHAVPPERRQTVIELINLINQLLDMDHFAVSNLDGRIVLRGGIFVTHNTLDTDQFHMFLKKLVEDGRTYFPVVVDQVFSDLKPDKLLTEYLKKHEKYWK